MMAQKNHKNKTNIVHHLLKNSIDFELLWRCISKIRNETTQMTKEVNKREIIKKNKRIIYIHRRLRSVCLLVRMTTPSEFVTVDLEKAWRTLLSYDGFIHSLFLPYCNCNVLLSELTTTRRRHQKKSDDHQKEKR